MTDFAVLMSGFSAEIALICIFLVLIACGIGMPFSEEIPLIASGYLVYRGVIPLVPAIIVPFIAVLLGDLIIFTIGKRMGLTLFEHRWFKRIVNRKRLRASRRYFEKYGNRIVFFARFVAGLRAPVYVTAAILRMRYFTFFLLDLMGAMISVPLTVYLAFYFGEELEKLGRAFRSTKVLIIALVVIIIGILLVVRWRRKKERESDTNENA